MQTSFNDVTKLGMVGFGLLAWFNAWAAPGIIILFNGTSSAGRSSLAEAVVENSTNRYAVVSFDDFLRAYRTKHHVTAWKPGQYQDCLLSLYRHAKEVSVAGTNVIIDTVEFDHAYKEYCEILDCRNVVKALVYCRPEGLLKRIERRNESGVPENRRPVLLSFQQFRDMYRRQTFPDDLEVERTNTRTLMCG